MFEEIDRFLGIALAVGDDQCPPNPPEIPTSSVERLISTVQREVSKYKPDSHDDWKSSLLDSIERLSSLSISVSNFTSDPNYRKTGNSANKAVLQSMSFLEEEFRLLLETYRKKPVGETAESSAAPDADEALPPYPEETVDKLQRIAKMMISAGYDSECCQVFSVARRKAFDDRLSDIGFGKISVEDVQKMPWQTLGGEVVTWIRAFRETVSSLLPQERTLCESIFSSHQLIAGTLFGDLARGVVLHLLNFAEAVASAEKLFKVLNMYETLTDTTPKTDTLFPGEGEAADLKTEISGARARIGEAAAAMFRELEASIKTDAPKSAVPGGRGASLDTLRDELRRIRVRVHFFPRASLRRIVVRGGVGTGDGLVGFEHRSEVEALQGDRAELHLLDEQREVHREEDQGIAEGIRGVGEQLVPEEVERAAGVPQELPEGDVVEGAGVLEGRGAAREGERVEAGAEGVQRDGGGDTQDAEDLGGERRAAAVGAEDIDISGGGPRVPVVPREVRAVPEFGEAAGEVHQGFPGGSGDVY